MTDEQTWIIGLKNRCPDSLRAVYAAYKDELFSLALVLGRDRTLAEDVLHDVFVHLARKGPVLNTESNLKSYLAMCVANRLRTVYRRQRPTQRLDDGYDPETVDSPDIHVHAQETNTRIAKALELLPEDQREVVVLHVHSGLTFKAIAEQTDVSINTVQSRYRYGLTKLKTHLNSEMER